MTSRDFGIGLFAAGAALIIWFISIAIAVAIYVIYSIQLQKAFERLGYNKPWIAWIPFANFYAMAALCEEPDGKVAILNNRINGTIFRWWWAIAIGCNLVPGLGQIAYYVIKIICGTKCYANVLSRLQRETEQNVLIPACLSVIIPTPIVAIVFLFIANINYDNRTVNNTSNTVNQDSINLTK